MKKSVLIIVGLCLLVIGGPFVLSYYQGYQEDQQEISKIYDRCMSDDFMSRNRSDGEMKTYCQCTAKLTHESEANFQEAMDSFVALALSTDGRVPLTPANKLNIGILYYCDGVALND